jgi:hypothetical protein
MGNPIPLISAYCSQSGQDGNLKYLRDLRACCTQYSPKMNDQPGDCV